jgi:BON domain
MVLSEPPASTASNGTGLDDQFLQWTAMQKLQRVSTLFFALLLMSMLGCAATPTSESTGGYVDDSVITTKVKAAIFNEPSLKSAEINVETFKGVVQLSGFVSSQADIDKAVEVARSVGGVRSVKNDMRLK